MQGGILEHNLELKKEKLEAKYTESLLYEIFLTGKHIKKMGEELFKKMSFEFTSEEFSAIDFLYKNNNMVCQRDIAVKMLINRGNMGKILNSLEQKGLIERILTTRQNRPVKIVKLTEKGEDAYFTTITQLRKQGQCALSKITKEEAEVMTIGLHKIRGVLNEILELDI